MFSFRRKTSKKHKDHSGPPYIRSSPSLPELSASGIPWPEDLIDTSELPKAPQTFRPNQGANGAPNGRIASLYTSPPPSAFNNRQSTYMRLKPSQRRNRNPATFNIMVAGAQGTGKTSLLRLLLETAEISPTATPEQRSALENFLRGAPRRTDSIHTASVEICESRYDRLTLTVVDTPGLDFARGHELTLERQVSAIVKYTERLFADTLSEESKVVRQSKGDQHVHLCIYAIDPSNVQTVAERGSVPFPTKTGSESSSNRPSEPESATTNTFSEDLDEESYDDLAMSPADIAVMRRLMKKTNVLPIIARADSLTDDKLAAIKRAVRRDMEAAGLDLGVFAPAKEETRGRGGRSNGRGAAAEPERQASDDTPGDEEEEGDEPEDERDSRKVIKLKSSRNPFKRWSSRSRSRTRLELAEQADEPAPVDAIDDESVANVRFSATKVAKHDLAEMLPFAVIAPEGSKRRRQRQAAQLAAAATAVSSPTDDRQSVHTDACAQSEDAHGAPSVVSHASKNNVPLLSGPPEDLRGVFVRKFRWGTVDVLQPEHCDFAALRTAVLSTHMKMLKIRTKEVLYEKYRTEKLLARRATKNISEDQARRMLDDVLL